MLSNRPYLLHAFYQWIVDSNCTPILVIDAHHPKSKIPQDYVEGGEIVFNVAPVAVRDFKISKEQVEFKASFSGVIHLISAPIKAILAVYAEENGEGIFFDAEDEESDGDGAVLKGLESNSSIEPPEVTIKSNGQKGKPFLRLVE